MGGMLKVRMTRARLLTLALAVQMGVDLLVLEGMGRAVHTNFRTRFKCDTLKLAMIKTERIAKRLFGGQLYDCVCVYEPAPGPLGHVP